MLGALVGLRQEARILRRVLPDIPIALSNATADGAAQGARRLVQAGATRLLSFGCAGGLSTSVAPGTILIADYVHVDGMRLQTCPALSRLLGSAHTRRGAVLSSDILISTALEKQHLYQSTNCVAVDMESGVVARSGLPFAVLRVVCDDACQDLPPAACMALAGGKIRVLSFLGSLMRHPAQVGALIRLGQNAGNAQAAMIRFLNDYPPSLLET